MILLYNIFFIILGTAGLTLGILWILLIINDYNKKNLKQKNMKELPDKWCFKVNTSNYEEFKYLRSLYSPCGYITSRPYYSLGWGCWSTYSYGTEITFEDFKRLVLKVEVKKEPEHWYIKVEDIPEYVEVLGGFDSTQTGKIFKTSDKFPSHLAGWNYGNWKETLRLHGKYFKSSTKEAYDAQFVKYDKEQSLKKEDLVKGEFYFFGKDSWEYDYIEYYSHDDTYPTIKKRKNGSDWFFDASNYWSSFADAGAGFIRKATAEEKDIAIKIMEEKRINLRIKKTEKHFKEKSLKDAVYQNLEVLTKDWIPNVTEFISPFGNKYTFTGIGSWTVEGSIYDASRVGALYNNGIYAQKHVDKPWCENVEDFFTKSVKTGSHYGIYSGFQKNPLKYIWSTEPLNITSKEDVIKAPKPILWADNIKTDKKSNQLIIIKK